MAIENDVLLVQALFSFSGANNDELCFKKGDLIVVTQKEEGGWWEGTYDGNTGWFPSNYVKEYKPTGEGSSSGPAIESPPMSPQQNQYQAAYHSMVSKDIVDSERTFVDELQNIFTKYLTPLMKLDIISEFEYKQLIGNLEEILTVHYSLLTMLQEQFEKPCKEQRLGGTYLKMAPNLQSAHKTYISNHPKAVCVIEKYKDELNSFMESQGAPRPGALVLTTALSQPFRRLDKYPGVLQEFQRHIEESHPDRGDTQRSTHIYRELTTTCNSIRRQKQLELEVLTNKIYGWDGGETLSVLGEILHMRSVALLPDNRDRYLVLFPECLVILALSSRASSFIFEGKYNLTDLKVSKLEDGSHHKNAFEISGSHMEPIIAVCQSSSDQNYWTDILMKNILNARLNFTPSHQKCATLYNSPPAPPAHLASHPLAYLAVGRPYAILTKYFAHFYHKNIITKQLLRSLNGIVNDSCDISNVVLRRHRSEFTIYIHEEGSTLEKAKSSWNQSSILDSSHCIFSLDGSENKNFNSSVSKSFYNCPNNLGLCNLRKWKYRPNLCERKFSLVSQRDSFSSFCDDERFLNNSGSLSNTQSNYSDGQPLYISSLLINIDGEKHSTKLNSIVANPKRKGFALLNEESSEENNFFNHSKKITINPRSVSALVTLDTKKIEAANCVMMDGAYDKKNSGRSIGFQEVNVSSINIPAESIIFPSNIYISDEYDSGDSRKICDKTIYGSSDEAEIPIQSNEINKKMCKLAMFRSKNYKSFSKASDIAYYMSSCSGDEERYSSDFYETQRRQRYLTKYLSKSEPDIRYKFTNTDSKILVKYSSFYSQIVRHISLFNKEISYDAVSHRSSDSGLADVNRLDHYNSVDHKQKVKNNFYIGLSNNVSSKVSNRQFSLLHPVSSEWVMPECDSLLHTPSNTISNTSCTSSAPVSCISDPSLSYLEAASLDVHSNGEPSGPIYKSSLSAHWWLKASICPKKLQECNTTNITTLEKIADTSEMYSKLLHLKPSYHALKDKKVKSIVIENSNLNIKRVTISKSKECELTLDEDSRKSYNDSYVKCLLHEPRFDLQASKANVAKKQIANRGKHLKPNPHYVKSESISDTASMHSFYESGEGANVMSFLEDLTEGLPLNFCRKGSSQSDVGGTSIAWKPSLNPVLLPSLSVTDPSNVTHEFSQKNSSQYQNLSSLSLQADGLTHLSIYPPRRSNSLPHVSFHAKSRNLQCNHPEGTK